MNIVEYITDLEYDLRYAKEELEESEARLESALQRRDSAKRMVKNIQKRLEALKNRSAKA